MKRIICLLLCLITAAYFFGCTAKPQETVSTTSEVSSGETVDLPKQGDDNGSQYYLDEEAIMKDDALSESGKLLYNNENIYGITIDGNYILLPCDLSVLTELGYEPVAAEYEQISKGTNEIVVQNDGAVLHLVVHKTEDTEDFTGTIIGISVFSSSTDINSHEITVCGIKLGGEESMLLKKLGEYTEKFVNQHDVTGRQYFYINPNNASQYFIFTTGGGKIVRMEVCAME